MSKKGYNPMQIYRKACPYCRAELGVLEEFS
jgi:hypothetical protein